MNYFLAKTEPSAYSVEDLRKDGQTVWSGVRSSQAVIFIKTMRPGDRVFIYHSTGESAIRGLAEVVGEPRPDDGGEMNAGGQPKFWVVDLKFLKIFDVPVTLKEIKETGLFGDFRLVYQSRLSVMGVPEGFVEWIGAKGEI